MRSSFDDLISEVINYNCYRNIVNTMGRGCNPLKDPTPARGGE
jgi:hypothetical protein